MDLLSTPSAPMPVETSVSQAYPPVTPSPLPALDSLSLPPSGFRQVARNTGRALGYVTMPVWWPLGKWVEEMGHGAKEVLHTPSSIKAQTLMYLTKVRVDAALWDSWTPEQRRSVVRQKSVWAGLLVAGSVLALSLPSPWNLIPILSASIAWWLGHHAIPGVSWRWDVVRWALRLPQIQELTKPVPQEDPGA